MKTDIQIPITMVVYILLVIGIGLYFSRRANKNSKNYFLGGRSIGPWVTALSAEASDMSGYLLMGLPGLAYWCSVAEASWTAIGLAVGTYLNWLLVSKRLRSYSIVSGDAITIPDFLSNRFHEKKKVILTVSAAFIFIFFTVYSASCFSACGKLFAGIFNADYHTMMIIGAVFVLFYTLLGGFLAESASDLMQSIVMICALVAVLVFGTIRAGGINAVIENAKAIPGYFSLTSVASPEVTDAVTGAQIFNAPSKFDFLTIISTLSWGLGYFGVPQVLLRFMAIRNGNELKNSRRIATIWVVISLAAAVLIGIIGRSIFKFNPSLVDASSSEGVFAMLASELFPGVIAGIITAGILAAIISSSDSYLLIAASSVSKNIYQGVINKKASDKKVMLVSRVTLLIIALAGIAIAWDENSVIFKVVSFAWAGFGATFGPIILFSLFWKRTTRIGAIAGMLSGGISVFLFKLVISKLGGVFAIYELLPAFIISCIFIVVFSLISAKPSNEICEEFDKAKEYAISGEN